MTTDAHRHQVNTLHAPYLCACGYEWLVERETWSATKAGASRRETWGRGEGR
jgi:hypothetical protein